jgi:Holliday junction DNA helicase RuvB
MEDFQLDLIIGEGPSARSVKIDLPKFTLVGATTRLGLLTTPLRDRFGIPLRMNFYTPKELTKIIMRAAKIMGANINEEGALEVAKRSRGTPRVANRLLRRVRDFATVKNHHIIDAKIADESLSRLDVDSMGLDSMDRRYLTCIVENYGGGPVGVETISAVLAEQRDMVEDVIEPYLMQQGLIQRTPRGRVISEKGYKYLGLKPKVNVSAQFDMIEEE